MFLEYLIDYNIIKHMAANADGCVCILHLKLQRLWASMCADFTNDLLEKLDVLLFDNTTPIRDYVWFLKQNKEKPIDVFIVIFGNREIFAKLEILTGALQDILPSQEFLKDFEVDIPTVTPECRKSFIMRHAKTNNDMLLLDCGFALDFESPENKNN